MFLLVIGAFTAFFLYKVAEGALPQLFLVPPQHWQDKINRVIGSAKPVYLKVGLKRSSFRKRLVGASFHPSFYTNFVENKIILLPIDIQNRNTFTENLTRRDPKDPRRCRLYGFFHPYANNGGGGEKVLWQAVHATLAQNERNIAIIYTTNVEALPKDILHKVGLKFDIKELDSKRVVFVYLRKFSKWIDADGWKHFTLIGQLLGSMLLALEALFELTPDVWVDTMGLPGSYLPVSIIVKIPIIAYVHYPVIQLDMFNKLKFQKLADLTKLEPSLADLISVLKFGYWTALYYFYTYLGSCVDITLANGTWTYNHLKAIWSLNGYLGKVVEILYPPCATETLVKNASFEAPRENKLLYIAQFRPEKRHDLVLEEFAEFLKEARTAKLPLEKIPSIVFLGSCRTPEDSGTLKKLRTQVTMLKLTEYVEFVVDCSFDEVKEQLKRCKFGLNAMWNEHFGIGVVEYVSCGVVPIVHASAGPLLDICTTSEPSLTWENDFGFFFKSLRDPDFHGIRVDNNLAFTVRGERALYPPLHQLLNKIYIEDPEIALNDSLAFKRMNGSSLMLEKFSNLIFDKKWMEHLTVAELLEETFRLEKRGKVEAVY